MENKTLTIIRTGTKSQPAITDNASIHSNKEKWDIEVSCRGEDQLEREQALITIAMLDKKWTGTMQDFMAIQTIANNALGAMEALLEAQTIDYFMRAEGTMDTLNELAHLLSLFK